MLSMQTIVGYQVSFEPTTDQIEQYLAKPDLKEYLGLFERSRTDPTASLLLETLRFKEKHPLPQIDNLLCYLYIRLKEFTRLEQLIAETYRRHPAYFFARINYAEQLLRKKKYKEIPELLHPSFDPRQLYPEKKTFHYSEFRGYMVIASLYFLATRQRARAEEAYQLARAADPDHPSILYLEKKLFSTSLLKKLARILRIG